MLPHIAGIQTVLVPDPGLIDEEIGLGGKAVARPGDDAAEAQLGLEAQAVVAEQGAGIVAAADRIVADRIFLEAQQRVARRLPLHAEREGDVRHRSEEHTSELQSLIGTSY